MIFAWYPLFILDDFLETGLVAQTLDVVLEEVGEVEILIARGLLTSIIFRDVFLTINLEDQNPLVRVGDDGTYGVYLDDDGQVWLGIEVEE